MAIVRRRPVITFVVEKAALRQRFASVGHAGSCDGSSKEFRHTLTKQIDREGELRPEARRYVIVARVLVRVARTLDRVAGPARERYEAVELRVYRLLAGRFGAAAYAREIERDAAGRVWHRVLNQGLPRAIRDLTLQKLICPDHRLI